MDQYLCIICHEGFDDEKDMSCPPCRHVFHMECMQEWCKTRKKCPICSKKIGRPTRDIRKLFFSKEPQDSEASIPNENEERPADENEEDDPTDDLDKVAREKQHLADELNASHEQIRQLTTEIQEAGAKTTALTEKLAASKAQIRQLEAEAKKSAEKSLALISEVVTSNAESREMKADMKKLSDEKKALQVKFEASEKEARQTREEIEVLTNWANSLTEYADVRKTAEENEKLKQQMQLSNKALLDCETKYIETTEKLEYCKRAVETAQDEKAEIEEELVRVKDQYAQEIAKIKEESECCDLDFRQVELCASLQNQLDDSQKETANLKNINQDLGRKIEAAEEKIKQTTETVERLTTKLNCTLDKNIDLEVKLDVTSYKIKSLEEFIDWLYKQLEDSNKKLELNEKAQLQRSSEMTNLNQSLDESRRNYKEIESKSVGYYKEVNKQKRDIQLLEKEKADLVQKIDELKEKVASRNEKEMIEKLTKKLKNSRDELEQNLVTLTEYNEEKANLLVVNKNFELKLEVLDEKVKFLEAAREEDASKMEREKSFSEQQQKSIDDLSECRAKLTEANDYLRTAIQSAESEFAKCKGERTHFMENQQNMQNSIDQLKLEIQGSLNSLSECQKEKTNLADVNTGLKADLVTTKVQIQCLKDTIEGLTKQLQESKEKLEINEKAFSECRAEKASFENELSKCQTAKASLETMNRDLRAKVEKLGQALSEYRQKESQQVELQTSLAAFFQQDIIDDLNKELQECREKLRQNDSALSECRHKEGQCPSQGMIDHLNSELQDCKKQNENTLSECRQKETQVIELQVRLSELTAFLNQKDGVLNETTKKLEIEQTLRKRAENVSESKELTTLKQSLENSRRNYKQMELKTVGYYNEVRSQKRDIQLLEKEKIDLVQKIDELTKKVAPVNEAQVSNRKRTSDCFGNGNNESVKKQWHSEEHNYAKIGESRPRRRGRPRKFKLKQSENNLMNSF